MKKRFLAGIFIFIAAVFLPPFILAPFVIIYAFTWSAVELIVLAAIVDFYFAGVSNWPYYTLAMGVIVISAELLKPYLSFVKQD